MSWTKLSDNFHSHPKVLRAWRACDASVGLYARALSYAGDHLTDGRVSEAYVAELLPQARRRKLAVAALVDAGLWETVEDGWQIHDYLEDNPSRDEVQQGREALSAKRSQAGRRGATARWQKDGKTMAPSPSPSPVP